ncbi:OLC1v1026496C1 [Oldenlandia corymbosa var. corymbosa]|uniref:OLC1v1026496C1 n=1 Tax=Oldenlandia corymbosa var. corymbosa TaxID=529605 RepID=A0AAV1CAI3_OLDCO|nr:OLC1v1026496C1 [Oldenlandia corymbosa var. corymbosa]
MNTPKTHFLSTPFLPSHPLFHLHKPLPPHHSKSHSISALILPNGSSYPNPKPVSVQDLILPPSSSSSSSSQQRQLYQPFRPPPSPLPLKFRDLDINGKLEILTDRLGLWFEFAPLIPDLVQDGFTPSIIEEITGITGVQQNCYVVASQVRESLIESGVDDDIISSFDVTGAEILYEIRLLSASQRAAAAKYLVANEFDAKMTQELARTMKDKPRRKGEKGWDSFDDELPGDCLGYMYYRLAHEHKATNDLELWRASLEKALNALESETARKKVLEELEGKDDDAGTDGLAVSAVKVPVVRMKIGEVAEATSVAVLPVCRAEGGTVEVEDAPWECGSKGDFGVVEAEKGWKSWVVLPRWEPVAGLNRGGVAVAFKDSKVLPWKASKWNQNEPLLVVTDRGSKEVVADDGFYLVVGGGNGNAEEGLKVEKGSALKESSVKESLGSVLMVVRPPRDDYDDQISDEEWD